MTSNPSYSRLYISRLVKSARRKAEKNTFLRGRYRLHANISTNMTS